MKFSVFQLSRIGGRQNNEDRMGYCYTRESGLFVLADGMGGHPQGEVAAQLALETISALYQKEAKPILRDATQFLSNALLAAHLQINRHATRKAMLDTPRTTLVAAVVQGNVATCVHCGDSRLYVVREGELLMRTRDHSFVEQRNAAVTRIEHLNRNILFSCLGSTVKPVFDITGPIRLMQGDKLLLCSDGLWGSLSDDEIVRQLASRPVADAVPEDHDRPTALGAHQIDHFVDRRVVRRGGDAIGHHVGDRRIVERVDGIDVAIAEDADQRAALDDRQVVDVVRAHQLARRRQPVGWLDRARTQRHVARDRRHQHASRGCTRRAPPTPHDIVATRASVARVPPHRAPVANSGASWPSPVSNANGGYSSTSDAW